MTSYTPGTHVWMKVYNRIWWPGQVVDPTTTPEELQDFMNRKKNPIALIYFEREKKYDIAINQDKLSLYNGNKKMEFIKKGYSMYLKQKKGSKIQNVNMEHFIEDVLQFERELNGDVDIFKQFETKKDEHVPPPKELIKELFVTSKEIKRKESISRKSLPNLKTPIKSKVSRKPSPSTITKKPMQDLSKTVCSTETTESTNTCSATLKCHLKSGCNFSTPRYESLKRHMALCKLNEDVNDKSPNKRKCVTKKETTKKTCMPNSLVNNLDDRDKNGSLDLNAQPGCSTFTAKKKGNNLNKNITKKTVLKNDSSSDSYVSSDDNCTENLVLSTSELLNIIYDPTSIKNKIDVDIIKTIGSSDEDSSRRLDPFIDHQIHDPINNISSLGRKGAILSPSNKELDEEPIQSGSPVTDEQTSADLKMSLDNGDPINNDHQIHRTLTHIGGNLNKSLGSEGVTTLTNNTNKTLTSEQITFEEKFINDLKNGVYIEEPYPVSTTGTTDSTSENTNSQVQNTSYFDKFPLAEWLQNDKFSHMNHAENIEEARNFCMKPNKLNLEVVPLSGMEQEHFPSFEIVDDLPSGSRVVNIICNKTSWPKPLDLELIRKMKEMLDAGAKGTLTAFGEEVPTDPQVREE